MLPSPRWAAASAARHRGEPVDQAPHRRQAADDVAADDDGRHLDGKRDQVPEAAPEAGRHCFRRCPEGKRPWRDQALLVSERAPVAWSARWPDASRGAVAKASRRVGVHVFGRVLGNLDLDEAEGPPDLTAGLGSVAVVAALDDDPLGQIEAGLVAGLGREHGLVPVARLPGEPRAAQPPGSVQHEPAKARLDLAVRSTATSRTLQRAWSRSAPTGSCSSTGSISRTSTSRRSTSSRGRASVGMVTTRRSACRCVGIAILFARVAADFAATGGVHQAQDALKLLMAGANVMMLASALLLNGPGRRRATLEDLSAWLEENEYASVVQLRGSMSQLRVAEPAVFERAHYLRTVGTFFSLADPLAVQSAPRDGSGANFRVPLD